MIGLGLGLNRGAPIRPAPLKIPGCRIWLAADYGISESIGAVTRWVNRGNGTDFEQTVSANRPLLQTNQLNGLPGILFDGSNDFLASGTFDRDSGGYTVFAVIRNASHVSGLTGIFNSWRTDIASRSFMFSVYGAATPPNTLPFARATKTWPGDYVEDTGDQNYIYSVAKWIYGHFTAVDGEIIAGIDFGLGEFSTVNSRVNQLYVAGSIPAYLGCYYMSDATTPVQCYNGHVFEILYYDRALTAKELSFVADYIENKWSLSQRGK